MNKIFVLDKITLSWTNLIFSWTKNILSGQMERACVPCLTMRSEGFSVLFFPLFLGQNFFPINYVLLPQLKENFTQILVEKQDLHVFILDDQEYSLQKLMAIYGSRTRLNKEYWLFDVSSVKNPDEKFENLSLGKSNF